MADRAECVAIGRWLASCGRVMAHNPETKARALAMLLTGDTPQFVAEQTGVPLTTVKRWQKREAGPMLGTLLTPAERAALGELAAGVASFFPGLFKR